LLTASTTQDYGHLNIAAETLALSVFDTDEDAVALRIVAPSPSKTANAVHFTKHTAHLTGVESLSRRQHLKSAKATIERELICLGVPTSTARLVIIDEEDLSNQEFLKGRNLHCFTI
jgi:hypothetical protein